MGRRNKRSIAAKARNAKQNGQSSGDIIACENTTDGVSNPMENHESYENTNAVSSEIIESIIAIPGAYDQSNAKYSFRSRGHQCTCNALSFLAVAGMQNISCTGDIDKILDYGDSLYNDVRDKLEHEQRFVNAHLTLAELPDEFKVNGICFRLEKSDVLCGRLQNQLSDEMDLPDLGTALQCLSNDTSSALLISGGYCIAVHKDQNQRITALQPC